MNDKLVGLIDSVVFFLFWFLTLALVFRIEFLRYSEFTFLILAISSIVGWRGFKLNGRLKNGNISCWNFTLDGAKWGGLSLVTYIFLAGIAEVYASGGHLDGAGLFSFQFLRYMVLGGGLFGSIGVFLGGLNALPLYSLNKWLNSTNNKLLLRP
jgi:hypothetical protein